MGCSEGKLNMKKNEKGEASNKELGEIKIEIKNDEQKIESYEEDIDDNKNIELDIEPGQPEINEENQVKDQLIMKSITNKAIYKEPFEGEVNLDKNSEIMSQVDVEVVKENESKDGDVLNLKDLFNEEIKLLRTALQSSDNLLHIFEYTDFTTDTLITGTARKLFEIITLNSEEGNILNSILLGDQEQIIKDIFLTLSIESESPSENWYTKMNLERHETDNVKIIKDSIVKLKKRKLKIQIDEVMKLIKQEPDNPHNLQRLSELKRREMELSN